VPVDDLGGRCGLVLVMRAVRVRLGGVQVDEALEREPIRCGCSCAAFSALSAKRGSRSF